MTAMCTANPYPLLQVGDGNQNKNSVLVKQVKDVASVKVGDLSPDFLQIYELDAIMPEDWKLTVSLYDKGSGYADELIGSTFIDMESRRHADLHFQNIMACNIELKNTKKKIKDLETAKKEAKAKKNTQKMDHITKDIEQQKKQKEYITNCYKKMKAIQIISNPIEFRELYHPQKNAAQGIIEMFSEIMTKEDAAKIPMSKIQSIHKENYEIRIVIWETRDIPRVDGGTVDIFLKVTFDPTGWSEDEVTKETDTHMSSKDGYG